MFCFKLKEIARLTTPIYIPGLKYTFSMFVKISVLYSETDEETSDPGEQFCIINSTFLPECKC